MKVFADTLTQEIIFIEEKEDIFSLNFNFGFKEGGQIPVFFKNANFGYFLLNEHGEEIFKNDNPLNNSILEIQNDEFIFSEKINNIFPEQEYTLKVWAENNNTLWENIFIFSLPREERPYKSWIYNEDRFIWEPPFDKPDDEKSYAWSEDKKNWIEVRNPLGA